MAARMPNPEEELFKNVELISPVKRCPRCGALRLEFDAKTKRIYCTKCGFEKYLMK